MLWAELFKILNILLLLSLLLDFYSGTEFYSKIEFYKLDPAPLLFSKIVFFLV